MRVELLYFEGCPSQARYLPRLQALLERAGVEQEVVLRRVETLEAAAAERFLGSPTVRVDGCDIEPGADQRVDFGLKCRLYRGAEGLQGTPPDEHLLSALRAAGHAGADHAA